MNNSTLLYGHEVLGRSYVTPKDIVFGTAVITLFFGCLNLWLLWKIKIFHNGFGRILATRTVLDMHSSALHIGYSSFVTMTQRSDYPPLLGIVAGTLGYSLASMSCSMHVLLAVNRIVTVYFPVKCEVIFSRKNSIRLIAGILIYVAILVFISFNGQETPFHAVRFIHVTCGTLFCFGAVLTDSITIRKLHMIKKKKSYTNKVDFNVQFRFTLQSFSQNIPMFMEIVLLGISDDSTAESKAVIRMAAFILIRFTDFFNSYVYAPLLIKISAPNFKDHDYNLQSGSAPFSPATNQFNGAHFDVASGHTVNRSAE
uniref:7TM_GPCR_Srx domain-containing protein n=1 Tax=Steinernema glaseri TaxID=37863 RepID=A0A1I7Z3Q7_9BILA